MFVIVHPGIQNEYVFEAETADQCWEMMREFLADRHGGLAGGMLASCYVTEAVEMDLPCKGRAWNDTMRNLSQEGIETSFERTERSIAYYEDAAGNPAFFVEGTSETCDHGDPDHGDDPICLDCALAVTSNIFWEGHEDYNDEDARYTYRFLPAEKHGECWCCRASMLED